MMVKNFSLDSKDGHRIFAKKWLVENKQPKAIVQIAHGMAEHKERYDSFAKFLNREGCDVYANDHRGHGETAGNIENLGYFAEDEGWSKVIADMNQLTTIIKEENPNIPVILFGHSMGSFLTRGYIQAYGTDVSAVILCGTGGSQGILGDIAVLLAKLEVNRLGKRNRSKVMDKLLFGSFNKAFKPNRTGYDWLTRDEKQVDKYIKDKYCGEIATAGFYYDLLKGIKEINKKGNMQKTPKKLSMLIISGDNDPVGGNTKGVMEVYNSYRKLGMENISYKFYENSRHEILNEINKEEVYNDIARWIKNLFEVNL
ncbi:alpha/beta hydrolase [Alkaliphilus peptidifermentans]|uniref:Lysophospholipase, alpha-beta hydrolase superfamily n=1 Tax=Alkaliphilus peptidifermentans DSM 18978 TaxID=1120976 RepID=A0A1G5J1D0_9FIRM|nr:alpha/beta hydrolase [Alkaliphilus peptidifermentans]SCY82102.1 Lysophospholipase, alpha-beta hydrolase superfamily [Alkaliphilus peptidifermentans DSM 18978]